MSATSRIRGVVAFAALVACDHSPPVGPVELPEGLLPAAPTRMTYSPASNVLIGHRGARQLAFYRFCPTPDRPGEALCHDGDLCVGALPTLGGQRRLEFCGPEAADRDSIQVVRAAAEAPDGSLAWTYAARPWNASFSATPGLFVQRPGEATATRVLDFRATPLDAGVPEAIWWIAPNELVAVSGTSGTRIVLGPGATATTIPLDGVIETIDAQRRRAVYRAGASVRWQSLDAGEESVALFPAPEGWGEVGLAAVSAANGRIAVIQVANAVAGNFDTKVSRILLRAENGQLDELRRDVGVPFTALSLAPDGRSLVLQSRTDTDPGVAPHSDLFLLTVQP